MDILTGTFQHKQGIQIVIYLGVFGFLSSTVKQFKNPAEHPWEYYHKPKLNPWEEHRLDCCFSCLLIKISPQTFIFKQQNAAGNLGNKSDLFFCSHIIKLASRFKQLRLCAKWVKVTQPIKQPMNPQKQAASSKESKREINQRPAGLVESGKML